MDTDIRIHEIDWLRLKRRWLDLQSGAVKDPTGKLTRDHADFAGATNEQTSRWVTDGYELPGFTGGSVVFAPRKRRRAQWNAEQGRIDVTRALCGDENYRLTRSPREYRSGSRIEIGYGFQCGVPAEVIGQYGKVCAGIIRKLEAEGLDVSVGVISRASNYLIGVAGECELHVVVKRVNERADFRSWSAIFAPSGHRHLMFTGRTMHAEDVGMQCSPGFGGSRHHGWSVVRDRETIKIDCHSTGRRDPTATLTEQAKAEGIL